MKDRSGAVVRDAQVSLLDAQQAVVATIRTDAGGGFAFQETSPGSYLLLTRLSRLVSRRTAVTVGDEAGDGGSDARAVAVSEEVTVTANPGRVEGVDAVSQPVNVVGREEIGARTKAVVAQVANEEVGVHLQRTSPTIAGIFVRGLTGNKVSVFVDGQRYSTRRDARRDQHVHRPGGPRARSRRSRCCAGPAARSTAATRSAAACSS